MMKKMNIAPNASFQSIFSLFAVALLVFAAGAVSVSAKGQKYGVFVGIENYKADPLPGTAKDAVKWQQTMIGSFGFSESNTKLVLNDAATRAGILGAIASMAKKVGPGDLFIFTYSGHGTLFPDAYSLVRDEPSKVSVDLWIRDNHIVVPLDFYDAAIVPLDSDDESSGRPWRNLILDDEIFLALAPMAANGARVVLISDSCHSGTIAKGETQGNDLQARFMDPVRVFGKSGFKGLKAPADQETRKLKVENGFYLSLSAASDREVSWGGPDGGLFTTMMTSFIERSADKARDMTYSELHMITKALVVKLSEEKAPTVQTPQIDLFAFDVSTEDDSWVDRILGEKIFQP